MLNVVQIDRGTGNGRYGDVLDGLETLKGVYGSFSNAAVQCIRDSPIFQKAVKAAQEKADHE